MLITETPEAEPLTVDQLESYARTLSEEHKTAVPGRHAVSLLSQLSRSAKRLERAHEALTAAIGEEESFGSEEWLRDNFHVVQDQVREIRQHLPRQFYAQLPALTSGPRKGYPRTYLLACALIDHAEGRIDAELLARIVEGYQLALKLSIGEVWAIPIMLRIALVERLDRLAADVLVARRERARARAWMSHLVQGREAPDDSDELSPTFVVELLLRLRDQPPSLPAWDWLTSRLERQGRTADAIVQMENKREAARQLVVGNVIRSMGLLSALDWPAFFERVNAVEGILREDPAAAYAQMDFATRDRYRQSIEQLAKRSDHDEVAVANQVVRCAADASAAEPDAARRHHVGYYLISEGRYALEQRLGYRPFMRERIARFAFRHPAIGYLGAIAVVLTLVLAGLLQYARSHGAGPFLLGLLALAALVPVSELAVHLVNRLMTRIVAPRPLPKLALRDGIPISSRTMVVVPTLLSSPGRIRELLDQMEVRFIANQDPHLHFALLGDFSDATAETQPADADLVELAVEGIAGLNARYGPDRFLFFQRARRWNQVEQRWMGWERKRGKLVEFNRLLRGATDTSFIVQAGDRSILEGVQYVITLDSDTELPIDAARKLVGAMSHPLNRPRLDPRRRQVTEGYGILQPRIDINAVSANRTLFARTFTGRVGLDPYATACSDVYQDLFHEGSFVGKGIYDVSAFEASLADRIPDNTLLSHDLFEGSYARAGLCTDVALIDDYPAHYLAWTARLHRWVRGDWQIVRWLWRTVPDASGRPVANSLSIVARWKILDNLRRSLLSPSLVLLLISAWTLLPGSPPVWTLLVLLALAFPAYVGLGHSLGSRKRGVSLRQHLRAERVDLMFNARQVLLSVAFLAHQAHQMLDAIVRTLIRMLITRRHLLQWEAAAEAAQRLRTHRLAHLTGMWSSMALAAVLALVVLAVRPDRFWWAMPFLALWMIAPELAYRTGRMPPRRAPAQSASDEATLRTLARKTWRFFEELVGPADHWLVPDNFQEERAEPVATRTSPTNLGLQLLSSVAAHDFGYITSSELIGGLERTFTSLERLERYRGHFLNWYDTRTLAPLAPSYVSTVDSGNLAGYLLTLKEALAEVVGSSPIIGERFLRGVNDTAAVLEEDMERFAAAITPRATAKAAGRMLHEVAVFRHRLQLCPRSFSGWLWVLQDAADRIGILELLLHEVEDALSDRAPFEPDLAQIRYWFGRIGAMLTAQRAELAALAPWIGLTAEPEPIPSLSGLITWCDRLEVSLGHSLVESADLRRAIARSRGAAVDLLRRTEQIQLAADRFVGAMDFGFLFDSGRQLFSIGFNVTDGRRDSSYYDMLASEARLASFVAIATGKVPAEHWFKLTRSMTGAGEGRALLSWSGSMFEYFMPLLVMRSLPDTLLDETYRSVVDRQIEYGADRGVPWGCSESAYALQDLDLNYQYKAFGVPGLGLKRGLANDLVVAPYASILAAPLRPHEVARNLHAFQRIGAAGRFGFFDAVDFAPRGQSAKTDATVVRTFMAHHQGMSLVALDNCLHRNPMSARFHREPRVQAAELLLQERVPRLVPLKPVPEEPVPEVHTLRVAAFSPDRRYATPHTQSPRAHILSNGSYTVMVSNAGGGYSERHGVALTRWRRDITRDHWGHFIYVRDLHSGRFWSTGYQPTCKEPDDYQVTFSSDRAVFHRKDDGIEVHTEIAVSPEDDAEIRRVSLTNHTQRTRSLELTSYAEVVLAPHDADVAHPAFGNLFVQSEAIPDCRALVCTRRPREGQARLSLWHVLAASNPGGNTTEFETDRARFLGRARDSRQPAALTDASPLSNTVGAVLDPIVSLRERLWLPPGVTARLSFTTGFAESDEAARALAAKYHDRRAVARALALALTHASIELRNLNATTEDAQAYQRLASRLLYGDPRLIDPEALRSNQRSARHIWRYGISGDRPIVLARITESYELSLVKDLLQAHEYCRLKGFLFDLVVLNEHAASYQQDLQEQIEHMVRARPSAAWLDQPGGVFLRRAAIMPADDRNLLRAMAAAVLAGSNGSLKQQLNTTHVPFQVPPIFVPKYVPPAPPVPISTDRAGSPPARPGDLRFFNGLGGFTEDGREYVIHLPRSQTTPAPWSNVIANRSFGFLATESTPGYTWSENCHENRLTPWSNDPVSDPPGEALFLRDEETGRFWSATPLPTPGEEPYLVRHGQGYTTYEHTNNGWRSELTLFVPPDDPVKIWRLRLANQSAGRRRCSATLFVEWTLGETRERTARHVVTWVDQGSQALFARNHYRESFGSRVAFLDVNRPQRLFSADRGTFLGRNGSPARPAALERAFLSGSSGATLDPCGTLQITAELDPGQTEDIIFLLGEGADESHARELVTQYRRPDNVEAAFRDMQAQWDGILGATRIRTPDPALDMTLNRWLLYQTLSCRMWARSGFYQSGGAYGFRDQLQDCLALMLPAGHLTRAHILRAAARQFVEGDVQHWWHEPGGEGIRTRCSDDRLWLPFAALEYVAATGDRSILDEQVPFLRGRAVRKSEDDVYERASKSSSAASLYEHCARAVDRSLDVGAHGLPLIGAGDWNDGLNLVGHAGKGESVWLGWFLVAILAPLADVAGSRGDEARRQRYREHAARLRAALEEAWDGGWYRRAYFDDGTPLGSIANQECAIDSIAQSWAVISGAADARRGRLAMEAVDRELVRERERLILLLTPPFDRMTPDPGYIRGYVPGVRENGGQYTHAALWVALAFLRLGNGDRAAALYDLINPVNRTSTLEGALHYKLEPYVVAGDVYSRPPHTGRGGWSWYTGASGWMYRVGIEALLGISLRDGRLRIEPCIPRSWPGYEVLLARHNTEYLITVSNPDGVNSGVMRLELDGEEIPQREITFAHDGRRHAVNVLLGAPGTPIG